MSPTRSRSPLRLSDTSLTSTTSSLIDLSTIPQPLTSSESETERPLSPDQRRQRLTFASSLQSIVDDAEFLKSVDYATLAPIKRAVNPGITVPGISARPSAPVEPRGLVERMRGMLWNSGGSSTAGKGKGKTKEKGKTVELEIRGSTKEGRDVAAKYDDDVVPLPLNDSAAEDLRRVMKPIGDEEGGGMRGRSWSLDIRDGGFEVHQFADWRDQVEEVKKEACLRLGLQVHQVQDSVKAEARWLMLHVGEDKEEGVHTIWDEEFAKKTAGTGTFAVLRFIVPSARTEGEDFWILGDDDAADSCNDDPQFSSYYAAHFTDVEYQLKGLVGVRLEIVYVLRYMSDIGNSVDDASIPRSPSVQQSVIDVMKSWSMDNSVPWSACTLLHRPQEPRAEALEVGMLGPTDLRKLRLMYRLSRRWRFECFVAPVTVTKKRPVADDEVENVEVQIGRLGNLDGTVLDPPTSISTDLLVKITGVDRLTLRERTRERSDRRYKYYQYCRVMVFLWPTRFHGRHVEPLSSGDEFLRNWLSSRYLSPTDGRRIEFETKADQTDFVGVALDLCRRGSDMKPFCLDAALKIKDSVLYEAALPGRRTVDLIQRGVDGLKFKAMVPIISRTLDLGVPDDLQPWCAYLVELYEIHRHQEALPLMKKLVSRMSKIAYLSSLPPDTPNTICTTLKFFYINNLPSISEHLIRSLPHAYLDFWLPFLPQLHALCNQLKRLSIPGGEAQIWVDRALTCITNQHTLPTPVSFATSHPFPETQITPNKDFPYRPPSIKVLEIISTYGRLDLVRVLFRRLLRSLKTPESLLSLPPSDRDTELRFLKAFSIAAYNALSRVDATLDVDPHGTFFARILVQYLLPNLGTPPPREQWPELTCPCETCTNVSDFLTLHTPRSDSSSNNLLLDIAPASATASTTPSAYAVTTQAPVAATQPSTQVSQNRLFAHLLVSLPLRSDLALSRLPGGKLLLRVVDTPELESWREEQAWISRFVGFIRPKGIVRAAVGEHVWENVLEAVRGGSWGWAEGVVEVEGVGEDGNGGLGGWVTRRGEMGKRGWGDVVTPRGRVVEGERGRKRVRVVYDPVWWLLAGLGVMYGLAWMVAVVERWRREEAVEGVESGRAIWLID